MPDVTQFDLNQKTEEFCQKHGHVTHVMGLDEEGYKRGWCCSLCYNVDLDESHARITEVVTKKIYKIARRLEENNDRRVQKTS
jgi:hypothetical protein